MRCNAPLVLGICCTCPLLPGSWKHLLIKSEQHVTHTSRSSSFIANALKSTPRIVCLPLQVLSKPVSVAFPARIRGVNSPGLIIP